MNDKSAQYFSVEVMGSANIGETVATMAKVASKIQFWMKGGKTGLSDGETGRHRLSQEWLTAGHNRLRLRTP